MNKRLFFLSFFGVGLSRYAPGTMGSLASMPFAFILLYYLGATTLFLSAILLTAISIRQINIFENEGGLHDDPRIVVDEVVGMFIGLSMTASMPNVWFQAISVFVFFRYFDIKKPSFIGMAERKLSGGNGVMWDDVLAGFFAGALSWLSYKGLAFFGVFS